MSQKGVCGERTSCITITRTDPDEPSGQYNIGSGHTEKFNDLLVARRQKGAGRHWSQETSDALAALRTLLLNGGWARYWEHRQVLPLLAC